MLVSLSQYLFHLSHRLFAYGLGFVKPLLARSRSYGPTQAGKARVGWSISYECTEISKTLTLVFYQLFRLLRSRKTASTRHFGDCCVLARHAPANQMHAIFPGWTGWKYQIMANCSLGEVLKRSLQLVKNVPHFSFTGKLYAILGTVVPKCAYRMLQKG